MSPTSKWIVTMSFAVALAALPAASAQQQHQHEPPAQQKPPAQQQPDPHAGHAQHGKIPVVQPEFPRLGRALEAKEGMRYRLAQLEQMALEKHPVLLRAAAEVGAARGRLVQAGLYPNPVIGYTGEEIRGGDGRGGQQGFFFEQRFVTGGKLRLSRDVAAQEVAAAEAHAEAERWRVRNSVRMAFYRALAAQELLDVKRDLAGIVADTLRYARQLQNVGQHDETEVLTAEIEVHHAEIEIAMQQQTLARRWTELAAAVGSPTLAPGILNARIEESGAPPDATALLARLLAESPELRMARAEVARAEAMTARERRQPVPDVLFRGGIEQNRERDALTGRAIGVQGFAEVGFEVPLWNRNQGSVAAARSESDAARQGVSELELHLRRRFAEARQSHENARLLAARYRDEILPRAQRAYQLMIERYGLMLASYPQVLLLQRTLFQSYTDYIAALEMAHTQAALLDGFLLDMAVREDVQMPTRRMPGGE